MEQSKKPSSCLTCPREVGNRYIRGALVQLREKFAEGSQAFLDEREARELAVTLHAIGILDNPDDVASARTIIAEGFEMFDRLEAQLDEEREQETRFCVGALKMRARDERTQYDVTLCRSPKSPASGNLEQAIVTRKTMN